MVTNEFNTYPYNYPACGVVVARVVTILLSTQMLI